MKEVDVALRQILSELYPQVQVASSDLFQPLLDMRRGQMSSPAAIRVAAATRTAAGPIAQAIIERLAIKLPLNFQVDGGYVVAKVADAVELSRYASSLEELRAEGLIECPTRIVAGLETNDVPLYARLRIQATAALQAWLVVCLTGECEISLQPGVVTRVRNRAQFARAVSDAVAWCMSAQVKRAVPKDALPGSSAQIALWMAHQHSEALHASERELLDKNRIGGTLVIRMPNDGWLLSRERVLSELLEPTLLARVVARLTTDDAWCRWVFHLASAVPSGDLDPAVAQFDDYASPLYGARVLVQRLRRLRAAQGAALKPVLSAADAPFELTGRLKFLKASGELDTLVARSLFLPAWTVRAASVGEVGTWSQVLMELLGAAHRVLNAPELRIDEESAFSKQILAGIEFGISSILRPVAEGAWPD
jgi:hypothetical protein